MILPDPSRMPVGMPIIRQGPTDCQEAVGRAADRASSVSRLGPINRTVHRTCGAEGFGSDRPPPVARARRVGLSPSALGVWSMSTRKPSPRNRALRPAPEDLEDRQMLSATASGTDFDGDTWTLRLIGPGSLAVTKQDNGEINQITVAGAEPLV